MIRRLAAVSACCVALAACPHDFARPGDAARDTAADTEASADLPLPDLRNPFDLYPHPDTRCTPPCVDSLPQGVSAPDGVVVAPDGSLFVSEPYNNRIRTIAAGQIGTLSGTSEGFEDGPVDQALFDYPRGLALGVDGTLYVADYNNSAIRTIAGDKVDTLAGDGQQGHVDGSAASARFNSPTAVAVDSTGTVFVADYLNNRIRQISGGEVTTLAGDGTPGYLDGPAKSARFNHPTGVAVATDGTVYVADYLNNRIRAIRKGMVSTFAGDGAAGLVDGDVAAARFEGPAGLALGPDGALYVAEKNNHAVRMIKNDTVTTVAGDGSQGMTDGPASMAELYGPSGVAVDSNGTIYVADSGNDRIRVIFP